MNVPRPLNPVAPSILTERVYAAIKELLMDQRLEPQSRINIEQLARDLQVSATPVREALARLESEALVVKQPLRGYTSAPLIDPASFSELFQMRLLIEPFAARQTAELGSEAQFDALQANVAAMREARTGTTYAEYGAFAQEDAKFHEAIAAASGNRLLLETLVRLRPHVHLNRLYFHTEMAADAIVEHERIVTALRSRDAQRAADAMRDHIERSCARLQPAVIAIQPSARPKRTRG